MDTTRGGWTLTLTCDCGMTERFDGVVPGITVGRAERAGWQFGGGPLTAPEVARTGTCPYCRQAVA